MNKYIRCMCAAMFIGVCLTGCMQNAKYQEMLAERKGITQETVTSQPEMISLCDVVCFEEVSHSTYAYDKLSEAQKIWYRDLNTMLSARSDEPLILSAEGFESGLGEDDIDLVFQSVLLDHPEYFFVEGYEYTVYTTLGKLMGIELKGTYSLSPEECIERKEQIDAAVQEILNGAPVQGSDYEKIKYVYETIIDYTEYSMDAEENQNIYSVFVGHASVCQGYAKATQYLLNLLGVEATSVFGVVNEREGHTWNLIWADEAYYYVDTTWGDASYLTENQTAAQWKGPDINYDYLCITTEQLSVTHKIEHLFPVPVCDSLQNNYYVREGCYFETYDEEQLKKEFDEALQAGKGYLTIKCVNSEIYAVMLQELIDNQKIFGYLDESCETIAYIENEQQLSLTFWMTN